MKKLLTFTALGTILAAAQVQAAGYHLREQSAAAQGNAYAGATAGAENLSYAYFNAAGITRQKGINVNLGGTYIAPKAEAKNVYNHNPAPGVGGKGESAQNIVHAAVAPNMAASWQVNDKLYTALAVNVPYGMITKYDPEWKGRQHGSTSKLTVVTTTPMVAYKVTDKLSLGGGLQIQYIRARLTSGPQAGAYASVEGKAVDLGWQVGSMYEFNENTRLGVAYRSKVNHKIKGDMNVSGFPEKDIYAKLTTPAMLSMGIYHQLSEKWAVMAEYQRVFWSCFKDLNIKYTNGKTASLTHEHWRDTNFFGVGGSYQIDNQWKWRLGMAYDQSAVRLQHRTPRIPDSDRLWYSTGLNYQYNEHLSFDVAYTYIYAHKAHMDTALTDNKGDRVTASYNNSIQLFGLSLNYKF
jgi:long-chain fatty acid transport protein